MAENPVSIEDVAARWRPLSDRENETVDALLADGWALVKATVADLETRLDDETLDPALVVMVLCKMVIRVMRYADDRDVDDYTPTVDQAIPTGTLYLTDEDLAFLDGSGAGSTAFTIRAYGEPGYATTTDDGWLTISGWSDA